MSQRESTGEYYTPDYITQLISEFSRQFAAKRILDPACGSGGLLYSVHQAHGSSVETVGIELNPQVFSLATSKNPEVLFRNSDFFSLSPEELGTFDLIVCNPPFGMRVDKEISGVRMRSGEGAFILASLQLLQANGHIIFVIPEGILFRDSDKILRDLVTEKYSLEAIISLPTGTFMPYTGVKTSLLIVKNAIQRKNIFFAEYLEKSSLKQIITNYSSEISTQNLSQGFWIPIHQVQNAASWSYSRFRGGLDFAIIRQKTKYPTIRLFDLLEVDNHGRESQDAALFSVNIRQSASFELFDTRGGLIPSPR
jgi:type I restriction-modification system DNA methylase subunit